MRSSFAVLAGIAVTAAAQSTTVMPVFLGSAPLPGQKWAGAVANVNNDQTSYDVQCTAGCGTAGSSITFGITVGPSNFEYGFGTTISGQEASASETCQITGTTEAACDITVSLNLNVEGVTSISTNLVTQTTYSGSDVAFASLTVTSGVEKLAAATTSAQTASNSTGTAAAAGTTDSASSSGASSSASSSGASNSASGSAAAATSSGSGATSLKANGHAGDTLAFIMLSVVAVSVGALITL